MERTVDRARHYWRRILPALGVDAKFLVNRHGPCPICGGYDRFRFDDKNGDGTYFCNQCGAGNGIILVRKKNGWDHAEACRRIDELLGTATPTKTSPSRSAPSPEKRRRAIDELLRGADAPGVVTAYLAKRGLSVTSEVLLGHADCRHYGEDNRWTGNFPATIAPIIGADGQLESVHRIYDAAVTPRKKFMAPVRTIKGAAVRLFPHADKLAVTEGVETALAVFEMTGMPVWAVLNANNLREWSPPAAVSTVAVYGDNDSNFVGQDAAYALAKRLSTKSISVAVYIPLKTDTDWLDVLNAGGAA